MNFATPKSNVIIPIHIIFAIIGYTQIAAYSSGNLVTRTNS